MDRKDIVYVISDSVGDTAELVVRAVATQFNGGLIETKRNAYVNDFDDIEDVIEMAKQSRSVIAYTLVIPTLKEYLDRRAKEEGIMAVDLLNPLMEAFKKTYNKAT